jgi:ring-1,2-phenylacetyl-CoA epoxidase subunit PaaD
VKTQVDAYEVAAAVVDPELPMLTLADLGVLRSVETTDDTSVVVTITPTYSGCPALDVMRTDLHTALRRAGYDDVEIRTALRPAWTTDWISDDGKRKLAEAGIAPPGAAPKGPVLVSLGPPRTTVACPQCGSTDTTEISRFGATACKALRRCDICREPFEQFKEL